MIPRDTVYRLARPGGEYNALYAMARREGMDGGKMAWPTVVAERGGKVVGFLSTHPRDDAIVAGPAVIAGGRNMLMLLRLWQAYDELMRAAGVRFYFFGVDKGNLQHIARVKSLNVPSIGEDEEQVWFKREL